MLAPLSYLDTGGVIAGEFRHADTRVWFHYSPAPLEDQLFGPEYADKVWVNDPMGANYRLARIKKTVAYVVVEEGPDGSAVTEKWPLRNHKFFL